MARANDEALRLSRAKFANADLSEMKQAKRVAEELPAETLEMLFFQTASEPLEKRIESSEGIEPDVAVSYLSRLVITLGVADRLGTPRPMKSLKPRICSLAGQEVSNASYLQTGSASRLESFVIRDPARCEVRRATVRTTILRCRLSCFVLLFIGLKNRLPPFS